MMKNLIVCDLPTLIYSGEYYPTHLFLSPFIVKIGVLALIYLPIVYECIPIWLNVVLCRRRAKWDFFLTSVGGIWNWLCKNVRGERASSSNHFTKNIKIIINIRSHSQSGLLTKLTFTKLDLIFRFFLDLLFY